MQVHSNLSMYIQACAQARTGVMNTQLRCTLFKLRISHQGMRKMAWDIGRRLLSREWPPHSKATPTASMHALAILVRLQACTRIFIEPINTHLDCVFLNFGFTTRYR